MNPTFGTYLSLFECRRACLFCLRNSPELVMVDLQHLIPLFLHRKSTLKPLDSIPILSTIPGDYGPESTRVWKRTSIVRSASLTTGQPFNEKEMRVLFGRIEMVGPEICHHPLVKKKYESDITPSWDYNDPITAERVLMRYQTAVCFPFLASGKQISDYGTLCGECHLHMRWEEKRWIEEQLQRRNMGHNPSASDRIRTFMNGVRRRGCALYSISQEAKVNAMKISQDARLERAALVEDYGESKEKTDRTQIYELSMQEHKEFHAREVLPREERKFREQCKKIRNRPAPSAPPQPT